MSNDVFWVQVLEPGHPSRIEKVDADTEVGRDCEGMLVDDPTVSRRHIRLEPTAVGLVVVDLGSANGTFIDGDRIDDPVILQPGSHLKLGETEIVVHQAHATEHGTEGQTGTEVLGDSARISAEARRLNKSAAKTQLRRSDRGT